MTTEAHIARAQKMGRLLEPVVPFLPFDELVVPPVLKDPRLTYEYVERVAGATRAEIGLDASDVLDFEHLIHRFRELQTVLIPVLWGARDRHENALNIHLPESATTWVYLCAASSRGSMNPSVETLVRSDCRLAGSRREQPAHLRDERFGRPGERLGMAQVHLLPVVHGLADGVAFAGNALGVLEGRQEFGEATGFDRYGLSPVDGIRLHSRNVTRHATGL